MERCTCAVNVIVAFLPVLLIMLFADIRKVPAEGRKNCDFGLYHMCVHHL